MSIDNSYSNYEPIIMTKNFKKLDGATNTAYQPFTEIHGAQIQPITI